MDLHASSWCPSPRVASSSPLTPSSPPPCPRHQGHQGHHGHRGHRAEDVSALIRRLGPSPSARGPLTGRLPPWRPGALSDWDGNEMSAAREGSSTCQHRSRPPARTDEVTPRHHVSARHVAWIQPEPPSHTSARNHVNYSDSRRRTDSRRRQSPFVFCCCCLQGDQTNKCIK